MWGGHIARALFEPITGVWWRSPLKRNTFQAFSFILPNGNSKFGWPHSPYFAFPTPYPVITHRICISLRNNLWKSVMDMSITWRRPCFVSGFLRRQPFLCSYNLLRWVTVFGFHCSFVVYFKVTSLC